MGRFLKHSVETSHFSPLRRFDRSGMRSAIDALARESSSTPSTSRRRLAAPVEYDTRTQFRDASGPELGASVGGYTPVITSDPHASAARFAHLTAYMEATVLDANGFCCAAGQICRRSARSKGMEMFEGQLSHVGRHYDLSENGKPLRIIVVGQEYGQDVEHVSLPDRYAMVHDESGLTAGFSRRNPHMRGTTMALRLLFGLEATAEPPASEWLVDDAHQTFHLFDAFALVNVLLCSAVLPGTKAGRSTKEMRQHCLRHFRETLRILEPTVLVLEGRGVANWIRPVFDSWHRVDESRVAADFEGARIDIAALAHPSARHPLNWANPSSAYLQNVVAPTLRAIRETARA